MTGRSSLVPLFFLLLTAAPAWGQRVDLYGEVRASALSMIGSSGQFGGNGAPEDLCGADPPADGGAYVNGTAVVFITAPTYRYRLGLSLGYYGIACTSSLRRPLGGLDYRGRTQLSERTQLRSGLRLGLDVFDRTLDQRLGVLPTNTLGAAGSLYFTGNSYLELVHWLDRRHGLRTSVGVQTLQTDVGRLSEFTTLGPMTAADVQIEVFRQDRLDRLELPVRYRLTHFYPATLARDRAQEPGLASGQVPPAHDASLRLAWERRLSPLLTVRGEGGLAAARQDHLCLSGLKDSCSFDQQAPGVRGADRPPAGEVALGMSTTGTVVGEISAHYQSQRHIFDVSLTRGYEPNAYASGLDLVNRLSGSALLRPLPPLLISASLLIGHHGHTSPGRVSAPPTPLAVPQNRTMVMSQGSLGIDWALRPPVAIFAQIDSQVFAIRGERVQERGPDGTMPMRQVSAFPLDEGAFQTVWRMGFLIGVRVFTETPEREPNLIQNARAVP